MELFWAVLGDILGHLGPGNGAVNLLLFILFGVILGLSWGYLGAILGLSQAILGHLGALLWVYCGHLGRSLANLGDLGPSWAILGHSWALLNFAFDLAGFPGRVQSLPKIG